MARYRKRPAIVEATQYNGPRSIAKADLEAYLAADPGGVPGVGWDIKASDSAILFPFVTGADGQETWVEPGDWIVAEPDGGSHSAHKPDIFAATYEPVTEGGES